MRILLLFMVVFSVSCSNLSVQDVETTVTTIKGEEQMSDKVYSSPPSMSIDLSKSYTALIKTNLGDITVELFQDTAPNTVNNFVSLSKDNYYDNVIFHRVISGFMIQGGDPSGTGHGDMGKYPGYKFDDELDSPRDYTKGILAMANAGPNTNGSQFFIMHNDYPLPYQYTIFGNVTKGLDVVDNIAAMETDASDKPINDITILDIQIEEE